MSIKSYVFFGATALQLSCIGFLFYSLAEKEKQSEELAFDLMMQELDDTEVELIPEKKAIGLRVPFDHYITANGTVESSSIHRISGSVEGMIDQVFVNEGQFVEQNDVLFHIREEQFQSYMMEKKAAMQNAVAKLEAALEVNTEQDIICKTQELEEARINLEKQAKETNVYKLLRTKEAVSESELQGKISEYKMTQARFDRLESELVMLKAGPKEAIRSMHATEIDEKKACFEQALLAVEQCTVRSPITGVVMQMTCASGQNSSKETPVLVVAAANPLNVRVKVDATETWRILPGKELRAIAVHKGNDKLCHVLNFERMSPKADKDGYIDVIFSFDPLDKPVYFGEEYDIFVEATSKDDTSCFQYQFKRQKTL